MEPSLAKNLFIVFVMNLDDYIEDCHALSYVYLVFERQSAHVKTQDLRKSLFSWINLKNRLRGSRYRK
jgi:hypothetical protein